MTTQRLIYTRALDGSALTHSFKVGDCVAVVASDRFGKKTIEGNATVRGLAAASHEYVVEFRDGRFGNRFVTSHTQRNPQAYCDNCNGI